MRSVEESPSGATGRPGLAVDLDQGDVGLRIRADDSGAHAPAVGQLDDDALGAIDDVLVRQDAAVGVDDEAAAGAAARGIAVAPAETRRIVEQIRRIGRERAAAAPPGVRHPRRGVDAHDRRG